MGQTTSDLSNLPDAFPPYNEGNLYSCEFRQRLAYFYKKYNVVTDVRGYHKSKDWGPLKWNQLHVMAIAYPDHPKPCDMSSFQSELKNFVASLPCQTCVQHALNYVTSNPVPMTNSKSVQSWAWIFHNRVTERIWNQMKECGHIDYVNENSPPYFSARQYLDKYPDGQLSEHAFAAWYDVRR